MFETFRAELQKYDPGIHRLYAPASDLSIDRAESELGVEFPLEYRTFLRTWNGGLLFAKEFYDILIWSVTDAQVQSAREYDYDVVKTNRTLIADYGHSQHLIVIASYSDGSLLCLDMTRHGRPVLWLRDEKSIEHEWDTLSDWLVHEMNEGATLYDYHGNEAR